MSARQNRHQATALLQGEGCSPAGPATNTPAFRRRQSFSLLLPLLPSVLPGALSSTLSALLARQRDAPFSAGGTAAAAGSQAACGTAASSSSRTDAVRAVLSSILCRNGGRLSASHRAASALAVDAALFLPLLPAAAGSAGTAPASSPAAATAQASATASSFTATASSAAAAAGARARLPGCRCAGRRSRCEASSEMKSVVCAQPACVPKRCCSASSTATISALVRLLPARARRPSSWNSRETNCHDSDAQPLHACIHSGNKPGTVPTPLSWGV